MAVVVIAVSVAALFFLSRWLTCNNRCVKLEREKKEKIEVLKKTESELRIAKCDIGDLEKQRGFLLQKERRHAENLNMLLSSNLTAIPWLAGMMADFLTYDIEVEAKKLDWGRNIQREKKVASIREIRAEAAARIEQAKVASYQLDYLRTLFPSLDDIIETDYKDITLTGEISDYDPVRHYLGKDEWLSMSPSARNQLALDRYIASMSKSNWQIGRDYELSVAHEYRQHGYTVEMHGAYNGLEDLGRDLIARKNSAVLIIQCKYWAQEKTIHEKHIYQLYGTTISFSIEQRRDPSTVRGVFVTNTKLSDTAKTAAALLGIDVVEHHRLVDFPRIKCNIGRDEYGCKTKIYHLPMDDMYDKTKIENSGEFYAYTVEEAEAAGFRRAYKWHGQE